MHSQGLLLTEIDNQLQRLMATDRYPSGEQGGIFRDSSQPVKRLGLALEPFPGLGRWVIDKQLDAIWLHRPWKLAPDALPASMGVLYHHLPFDEYFTMGYSPPMAKALELTHLEPIGFKQAVADDGSLLPERPIGMLGDAAGQSPEGWIERIRSVFGGYETVTPGRSTLISRVAVVGAMNENLIREAADRGATLYLTGQYRPSASKAVDETGMMVIAVGHRRSEEWGLNPLAEALQPLVQTIIA